MACISVDRRSFGRLAACAVAGWAVPVLAARGRPEKTRVSLAVDSRSALRYLPLTIAQQLGFFKAEGVELDIQEMADDAGVIQAAVSGAADVVCGLYDQTIQLYNRGNLFRAFVLLGRVPQIALGVSTRTLPAYRSLADLRGRRIGVVAVGSACHMIASLALSRADIPPSDVSFVPINDSEATLAALRAGELDAVSHTDPLMTLLEQRAEVRIVADTRTLRGTQEVLGGPMPGACLCASSEFVSRYPATAQALADGIVHALKWLKTATPRDIVRTVPQSYMVGDRALYLAALAKVREGMAPDGLFPDDGARTALRAWSRFGLRGRPDLIDPSRTYTNDFAWMANERFRP